MADEEDRQPPQAYDTVSPAGVGASSGNVKCPQGPSKICFSQETKVFSTSAMEEMGPDPLYEFMQSIPPGDVIASWPDVDWGTPCTGLFPCWGRKPRKSIVP